MLNRIFVREQFDEEYPAIKGRFKIGIIGMGQAVGTSFVATAIAKELSKEKEKRIAYVEINSNHKNTFLYDSLGIDKRFAGRVFYNFYTEIAEGRNIAGMINLDERINWALCIPETIMQTTKKTLETIELCRLINNITADSIICDITPCDDLEQILKEMDVIVFVIDPLPSKLINEYESLCYMKKCQLMGQKIVWVVNKYNNGINKREFCDFIKIKHFIKISMVSQDEVYLAEYNCKIPYSLRPVYTLINEPIRQILHLFNN